MRAIIALVALCVGFSAAATIKWTGYAQNNQWASPVNWYPAQIPGPNDDVIIDKGDVQVTISVAIQSLSMGNSFSEVANITIYKTFFVTNTFTCDGNGNVIVQAGTDSITGTFNIAGNLYYKGGVLSGQWTTSAMGKAHMGDAGEKAFSGAQFVSNGYLSLGGVIALNQSSTITINGGATASGNMNIQVQDGSDVMFDATPSKFTYTGPSGNTLSVQAPAKVADVDFQADVSCFSTVVFQKALVINSGVTVTTMGNMAIVNMSSGVTGAGSLVGQGNLLTLGGVNMSGSLSVNGGNVSFGSAGNYVNNFAIAGGTADLPHSISCASLTINGGEFAAGAGSIKCSNGNIATNGFDWNGAVTLSGAVTFAPSLISFGPTGSLELSSTSTTTVTGTFTVNGQPGSKGITANGAMSVDGSFSTTNVNVEGAGSITVSQELAVSVATFTQKSVALSKGGMLSGSHSFFTIGAVTAPDTVTVAVGDYTFTCQKECDNVSTPNKTNQPTSSLKITGN